MQITRSGKDFAIHIPAALAKALKLPECDHFDIEAVGDTLVIRKRSKEDFLEQVRQFSGILPADFRFDREEAHER